jgi:hypothetical protein
MRFIVSLKQRDPFPRFQCDRGIGSLENVNIKGELWQKKFGSRGLIETVGPDFGDFRIDFLGEYEAICKPASARESGP